MPPGVVLTAVSLAVGWAALAPVRNRLGTVGYHLAALPVGLLGWGIVASVSMAVESGWGIWWPVALLAWAATVAVATRWFTREMTADEEAPIPWWSFPVVLFSLIAFAWAIAYVGITAYSVDGWSQYVPDGLTLHDIGRTSGRFLGHRMILLPAVHAAYCAVGGEFPHVIHPVMGLLTAALVWAGTWWATSGLGKVLRALVATSVVLLMTASAAFLFQALYIHSHMITAMYLLLALLSLGRATGWTQESPRTSTRVPTEETGLNPAWLAIAGLATSAITLARPDGAAYSVIPVAVAAAVMLRQHATVREVDAFFGPSIATTLLVSAGAFVQAGIWESDKLAGAVFLAFLGAQAIAWLIMRFLTGNPPTWLTTGTNPLRLVIGIDILALSVIWRRAGEKAVTAVQNMSTNLLSQGGYRFIWPYAAAVLTLSLALRPRSTRHPYTGYLLFAILQFFAIALAVHSLTHPGRLGWGDSFNRVSFHVLPVVYLYAGMYLGEVLAALERSREDSSAI